MLPQISAVSRRTLLRSSPAARRALSTSSSSSSSLLAKAPVAAPSRVRALAASASPIATPAFSRSFHASLSFAAETVKVPQMAESISEGTLKQWNKKKGDFVNADEEVATIETDKIDVTVNAPQSGTIVETLANEEDTVTVGQDLFRIEPGEAPAEGASSGGEESKQDDSSAKAAEEEASKKEAEQQKQKEQQEQKQANEKVDQKPAPQPKQQQQQPSQPKQQQSQPKESSAPAPAAAGARTEQRVKMNRMRLRIAERLKQSQNTAATLTTFNEIDMSPLMAFRARHKDRILKEHGIKLGFMGAFAKASALALKEIPACNASIEGEGLGDTIVYRDYVDLSVAVSTDKGLVTPVVRNAESMSILDIEKEIARLGKKARDNKLGLEDMTGGTFTISNGGVFGSLFGTPILNLPGSGILGMHAIKEKPWVVVGEDGKKSIEIRPIMVVALSYDHRILDGREAVTFLVKLKTYLEDLGTMSL